MRLVTQQPVPHPVHGPAPEFPLDADGVLSSQGVGGFAPKSYLPMFSPNRLATQLSRSRLSERVMPGQKVSTPITSLAVQEGPPLLPPEVAVSTKW